VKLRWPLAAVLAVGCAHAPTVAPPPIEIAPDELTVRGEVGDDADAVRDVATAASAALPALLRWGPLARPVTVVVLPSHVALEQQVHRPGYRWLRAWARYDVVYLQSPRSWGMFQGTQPQLTEMLRHELTHCATFQAAGGPNDWTERHIPLWFREGMASWAAGQEGRRWSRQQLANALRERPKLEPLEEAETIYRDQPELVYAAAHWAFVYLWQLSSEAKLRELLAAMKGGAAFPVAFHQTFTMSLADFERAFAADLSNLPR
jgi:hypothetical protein